MIALAELLLLLILAAAVGRTILSFLRLESDSAAEQNLYAATLGLGVIAYSVLGMGLVGLLRIEWLAAGLAALAALALPGWKALRQDFNPTRNTADPALSHVPQSDSAPRWVRFLGFALALVTALIVIVNCFVPPSTDEWDALSYHLAAPKLYLQAGRIFYLPTDHHSNFPFTMQMLFLLGLAFNGFALANLIHFSTAALTAAAVFLLARKRVGGVAAWSAVAVFVTCPMVVWESGAAYVEIGFALFVVTSLAALIRYRENRATGWLWLSAILMGFALSVKTLALIPLALTLGVLALYRIPVRQIAVFVVLAVGVGSPFYLKSWISTLR